MVPGGVLVFFGGYGVMNKVAQRWKTTKFWDVLNEQKLVGMLMCVVFVADQKS